MTQRLSGEHEALTLLNRAPSRSFGRIGPRMLLVAILWTASIAIASIPTTESPATGNVAAGAREVAEQIPVAGAVPDSTLSSNSSRDNDILEVDAFAVGEAEIGSASEPYFAILTKMGLGLGLVIGLVLVTVWLLRKSALGQKMGGAGGSIRVLERSFLAPKKAIYLVEIGNRTLALGVTEEHVGKLSEWAKGELDLQSTMTQPAGSFAAHLRKMVGRSGAADETIGHDTAGTTTEVKQ